MKKTLLLLRHGQSLANVDGRFSARLNDVELSSLGERQAAAWGEVISSWGVELAWVSPARRAQQTAQHVLSQTEIQPVTTRDLLEVDVGELDNQSAEKDAWERYESVRRAWEAGDDHVSLPQGESLIDIRLRLDGLIQEIEKHSASRILLIAHGMLFMCLMWLYGRQRGARLQDSYMDAGHLSVLEGQDRAYELLRFNQPAQSAPL